MSKLKMITVVASAFCFAGATFVDGISRSQFAYAQDPFGASSSDDPFGGDPFGGDSDGDLFGGGANAATTGAASNAEVLTTDPVALAFLNQTFDSAEKRVIAAITAYNLDEAKVAQRLLAGLQAPLTDQAALDFSRSIGSHNILALTLREDFPADQKAWFDETLANAMTFAKSEGHVAQAIETLITGEPESHQDAYRQLQVAGMNSASSLLGRIQQLLDAGDLTDPALRRLVIAVQQGSRSWDIALRSLATQESSLRDAAILGLAARPADAVNAAVLLSQDEDDISPVLKPVMENWSTKFQNQYGFTVDDQATLAVWIRRQMDAQRDYLKDLSSYRSALPVWEKEVWLWEPKLSEFVSVTPNRYEAPARNLALWSTAMLQNHADDLQAQDDFIVSQLQLAKIVSGIDLPLPKQAIDVVADYADADRLHRLLKSAVKRDQPIAAQAIIEAMATIGDASQLAMQNRDHAPLVHALHHQEPRVRFAAVQTILAWQPKSGFAGSSYFNHALAEVLGSTVGTQVVVFSTNASEAGFLNALVRNDGWESEMVSSTSELFREIDQQPVSLLVLTDAMGDEPFISVIDRIRELPKGANLPIALLVHGDNLATAQQMFRSDRIDRNLVIASLDGPAQATGEFLAEASMLADRIDIPQAIKERKSFAALASLNQWCQSQDSRKLLNFDEIAPVANQLLTVPRLAALAAPVVGWHGNPDSQKRLAVLAGNISQSPAARSAAAASFRLSVQKFGILLTTREIGDQYDRQNRSVNESEFSQAILNSLLDTIEARHKQVAFDDLPAVPTAQ